MLQALNQIECEHTERRISGRSFGFVAIIPAMVWARGPHCTTSCRNGFNTGLPSLFMVPKFVAKILDSIK
jgi:hypothetical protein